MQKYAAYPFDEGITVTGNEQNDYFKVLLKATELLFPEIGTKSKHVGHGMMQFTTGKMSSRTGNVITGESLVNDMIEQSLEKMKERDMTEEEKEKVAKEVAVAAIKYTVLRQSTGKNIIFDPAKSLSFEGDSGPYLQYAYVRSAAILAKAEKEGIEPSSSGLMQADGSIIASSLPASSSEAPADSTAAQIRLERLLARYPETVERAWLELAPHHVGNYLMDLAGAFNSFYAAAPIVKKDDPESPLKISVAKAFSIVMRNGLNILGIKAPERM